MRAESMAALEEKKRHQLSVSRTAMKRRLRTVKLGINGADDHALAGTVEHAMGARDSDT